MQWKNGHDLHKKRRSRRRFALRLPVICGGDVFAKSGKGGGLPRITPFPPFKSVMRGHDGGVSVFDGRMRPVALSLRLHAHHDAPRGALYAQRQGFPAQPRAAIIYMEEKAQKSPRAGRGWRAVTRFRRRPAHRRRCRCAWRWSRRWAWRPRGVQPSRRRAASPQRRGSCPACRRRWG